MTRLQLPAIYSVLGKILLLSGVLSDEHSKGLNRALLEYACRLSPVSPIKFSSSQPVENVAFQLQFLHRRSVPYENMADYVLI